MQSPLKNLRGQELFQHSDNRCALTVADGIKKLAYFSRVFNFLLNGVGVLESVQAQSPVGVHIDELGPHLPFREGPIHRLGAHPGGETLVEPQVVPPLHSDQVAEPHMGHFVGYHLSDSLPGARRGVIRVHQQSGFPISDAAPVFHRSGGKVGDGNMVQLLQGVGYAEVIVEEGQHSRRSFQGETALFLLASGGPNTYPGVVDCFLFNVGQVSDDKGHKVGGHNRSPGKHYGFVARIQPRRVNYRRVGDGHHLRRYIKGQLKSCFAGRLVPAGEGAAGVGGLKLGGSQVGRFPFRVDVLAAVKAPQLVVERACKAQVQLGCARLNGVGKGQGNRFPSSVQGNGGGALAAAVLDQGGRVDLHFVGV